MGRYLTETPVDLSGIKAEITKLSAATADNGSIVVTATDDFAENDPVFLDWKSGTINNLNGLIASSALAAGPSVTYLTSDQADSNAATSTSVKLSDGSFVLIMASRNTGNNYKLVANRYNQKGILLYSNVLVAISATTLMNIRATVLSNGNIALTYLAASTATQWVILNRSMQVLSRGTTSGPTVFHVQETNNGGFIVFSSAGLAFVDSNGTQTAIESYSNATLCVQDELNDNELTSDNTRSATLTNYAPLPISGGGYGYIYYNSTGVYYSQINADGTKRGATATLQSYGSQGVSYGKCITGNGNICWTISLSLNVGYYGVVAENGTIIKAGTLLSGIIVGSALVKTIYDGVGGFIILGYDATPQWRLLYLNLDGTVKTGPTTIGPQAYPRGSFSRLSTGIFFLFSNALYNLVGVLIYPNGTVSSILPIYISTAGYSFINWATFVYNDLIYGIVTSGTSDNGSNMFAFRIDNAGKSVGNFLYTGVAITTTYPIRLLVDPTIKFFYSIASNANQSIVSVFDMTLRNIQSFILSNIIAGSHLIQFGQAFLACPTNFEFTTSTPANAAAFVKARSTILLGVAANPVGQGDHLQVNTKGIFSGDWQATQVFDQSSNTPPGNVGSVANGIIRLKGI